MSCLDPPNILEMLKLRAMLPIHAPGHKLIHDTYPLIAISLIARSLCRDHARTIFMLPIANGFQTSGLAPTLDGIQSDTHACRISNGSEPISKERRLILQPVPTTSTIYIEAVSPLAGGWPRLPAAAASTNSQSYTKPKNANARRDPELKKRESPTPSKT